MNLGRKMGAQQMINGQRDISAGQGTMDPPGKWNIGVGHKQCCWPGWTTPGKPDSHGCPLPGLQLSKSPTQGCLSATCARQGHLYPGGVY